MRHGTILTYADFLLTSDARTLSLIIRILSDIILTPCIGSCCRSRTSASRPPVMPGHAMVVVIVTSTFCCCRPPEGTKGKRAALDT